MYEFNELLEAQRKLDRNIIQTKQLGKEDRTLKKLAAFTTELGELVNELPETFKFWANKENKMEQALTEYVDGLHFILSMVIELGFEEDFRLMNTEVAMYTKDSFLEQILYLYTLPIKISQPSVQQKRYLQILMAAYIGLGLLIGLEWDEVIAAYHKKNAVNHERQEANY